MKIFQRLPYPSLIHAYTLVHRHTLQKTSEGTASVKKCNHPKQILPPSNAKQSLKLPFVADQQRIHMQQHMTSPTCTLLKDIFLIHLEAHTGYHISPTVSNCLKNMWLWDYSLYKIAKPYSELNIRDIQITTIWSFDGVGHHEPAVYFRCHWEGAG